MCANNSSGHEASRSRSWSRVELIDKSEVTIIVFGLEISTLPLSRIRLYFFYNRFRIRQDRAVKFPYAGKLYSNYLNPRDKYFTTALRLLKLETKIWMEGVLHMKARFSVILFFLAWNSGK